MQFSKHIKVLLLLSMFCSVQAFAQLTSYKLPNGLTVYLLPDAHASRTFGAMVVNAGSKNDPADATGLAHYLEHLLFKGSEHMGTTNFAAEKPHLDSITILYRDLAKTNVENQRDSIKRLINAQALKASAYGLPTEFHTLLSSIGGTRINAFTQPDRTVYHNSFPGEQMEKWLELYAERYNHPVFRSFQSELEVVYEEKNRGSDNFGQQLIETLNKELFPGHPYGTQSTIGTTEHLKNPPIDRIYDFYNTYYVANNMALVLSGNFDVESTKALIEKKMSGLRVGKVPEFVAPTAAQFTEDKKIEMRISPIKLAVEGFKSIPAGAPDEEVLEICANLLSNSAGTGYLDKLQQEGKLLAAQMFPYHQTDDGAEVFIIVPKLVGQSFKDAEGLVNAQFEHLMQGDFSDAELMQVKNALIREYNQNMEDAEQRGLELVMTFKGPRTWADIQNYPSKIMSLTKQDIMAAAKKYYGGHHITLESSTGFPKKDKLSKPGFKPVVVHNAQKSVFAQHFDSILMNNASPKFIDFAHDMPAFDLGNGNRLFHAENPYNKVASLQIKYHIGLRQDQKLSLATTLLNECAPQGMTLAEYKSAWAAINYTYSFGVDDDYFTISLEGDQSKLKEALQLLAKLQTNPVPSATAYKTLMEGLKAAYQQEAKDPSTMGRILTEYAAYGANSEYLQRYGLKAAKKIKPEEMLAAFKDVCAHAASLHYCGGVAMDEVAMTIKDNAQLGKGEYAMTLYAKTPQVHSQNRLVVVNDNKSRQNQVYFMLQGQNYTHENDVVSHLMDQYMGGDFSGLILQEIREFRSLAYSAGGRWVRPVKESNPLVFRSYVGCQADKTNEAINVMMDLFNNMPQFTDRVVPFQQYLKAAACTAYPSPRDLTETIENLQLRGYNYDPSFLDFMNADKVSFADMYKFYQANMQGHPVTVTIYGDLSKVDMEALKKIFPIVEEKKIKDIANY